MYLSRERTRERMRKERVSTVSLMLERTRVAREEAVRYFYASVRKREGESSASLLCERTREKEKRKRESTCSYVASSLSLALTVVT